jgi:hypothetical protein
VNRDLPILTGYDLIIEDVLNPNKRLFGGVIVDQDLQSEGLGLIRSITAQDYTMLLDRMTVRKEYNAAGQLGSNVIKQAIVDAYRGENEDPNTPIEIGFGCIQVDREVPRMEFKGASLSTVISQVASLTGYSWRIDYFKRLHYHPEYFNELPFSFSDAPNLSTLMPMYDATYFSRLATWNEVVLEGATEPIDKTDIYSGDAVSTIFTLGSQNDTTRITLPKAGEDLIVIEENTGTQGTPIWTELIVRGESDSAATLGINCDVIWNPIATRIEFASAPSNFTNAFRVSGRYLSPNLSNQPDVLAQERHGRRYKGAVIVPEAKHPDFALQLARAFLRDNSDQEYISFKTNTELFNDCLCQVTKITHSGFGLVAEPFFIYNISTVILGGLTYEHIVEARRTSTLQYMVG